MTDEQVRFVDVRPNTPENQRRAAIVIELLEANFDQGQVIAVLLVALGQVLIQLLHGTSLMPEQTVRDMEILLANFQDVVMKHATCCLGQSRACYRDSGTVN